MIFVEKSVEFSLGISRILSDGPRFDAKQLSATFRSADPAELWWYLRAVFFHDTGSAPPLRKRVFLF
jgi:hypothetical protein